MFTVKQLAEIAGVSVRTLHHYDEIGLLRPSQVGTNGYRYYDDAALYRLQQILFYREVGLELAQIRDVLDRPDFELRAALRGHRQALEAKMNRLQALIQTVDETLDHLEGGKPMSKKKLFQVFSTEQSQEYEREARLRYDPAIVKESNKNWAALSAAQRQQVADEGNAVYEGLAAAIDAGLGAESAEVQALMVRWHNHLRHFYEPPLELLRGLADLYRDDERFTRNINRVHPQLVEFMHSAINVYVDALETAQIERLLAEDENSEDQAGA